jgi:hypothetical protein
MIGNMGRFFLSSTRVKEIPEGFFMVFLSKFLHTLIEG